MSVVALVCSAGEAGPVVTWAGRFAAALNSDLVIFYLAENVGETAEIMIEGEEEFADPTQRAIYEHVEKIVRTRRARAGRIPRYALSLRRISSVDPLDSIVSRVHVETPELFVAACHADAKENGGKIARKVAARISCDTLVLHGDAERSDKLNHTLVATTEGRHDKGAVELAARALFGARSTLTVMRVEARVGEQAIEVGKRELRQVLRDLGLEESARLKVKVALGDRPIEVLVNETEDQDLVLVGADQESKIADFLAATKRPWIGMFRRAPQFTFGRRRGRPVVWLPRLNPTDYADLYEKLQSGSRWNTDFVMMLSLAAAIATMGLLQNSPAVVIGSMLLAPLMTPMIGLGLALNQGNAKLAYASFRAISRGFFAALAISFVIGLITPGSDPTAEVTARTEPNILDLLIALLSGIAAAYALARPSVAGSIAGVAIATALVPPLCSVGISLAYGKFPSAVGAAALLLANVLAIILAAALTFRGMGLMGATDPEQRRPWVRRVVIGLVAAALVISIPLGRSFVRQVHRGKASPMALTVTNETRQAILERVRQDEGVTLLLIGRPGIPREQDRVDVGIVLSSEQPLPESYRDELEAIVRETMQDQGLIVKVECVIAGWVKDSPIVDPQETSLADTGG